MRAYHYKATRSPRTPSRHVRFFVKNWARKRRIRSASAGNVNAAPAVSDVPARPTGADRALLDNAEPLDRVDTMQSSVPRLVRTSSVPRPVTVSSATGPLPHDTF